MIKLVLSEVVEAVGGKVAGGAPTLSVKGVSTDSRCVRAGELFFALLGPNFDGHAYVADAFKGGAVAAVVAAPRAAETAEAVRDAGRRGVLVEVKDPLVAWDGWRRFIGVSSPPTSSPWSAATASLPPRR